LWQLLQINFEEAFVLSGPLGEADYLCPCKLKNISMNFDLIIIGTGPGGYVAAIRASQLGMNVAVVERESLGGICLNWGCIPTKALLKSAQVFEYIQHAEDYGITIKEAKGDFGKMIQRSRGVADGMSKGIQFLMKKNKITVINGIGRLVRGKKVEVTDAEGKKTTYEAKNIILATGGRAKELPNLKIDGEKIIEYRKAMSMTKQPSKMVVVGAGAIGVEFAYFYNSIGTEVTVVEFMEQGLVPREDADISRELARSFKKKGINVLANSSVEKVDTSGKTCKVTVKNRKDGSEQVLECDVVLSAAGVTPNTENIGLEELGIKTDRGMVIVDEYYQTNVPGIYAIGDIVPGPALAHVASAEGITCVEKMAGHHPEPIDYNNIPGCTYCSPEIASVGYTEAAAKEAGYTVKIGKFPFSASGKASAAGAKEGFVKVIFDAKYGEFLGAHMIGMNVTEMIAEVVVARKLETTGIEIIKSIHPHPTMSEAIMEAAAAAYDEVIHI
jgi:dihydrolipoamide dehydrogenase